MANFDGSSDIFERGGDLGQRAAVSLCLFRDSHTPRLRVDRLARQQEFSKEKGCSLNDDGLFVSFWFPLEFEVSAVANMLQQRGMSENTA